MIKNFILIDISLSGSPQTFAVFILAILKNIYIKNVPKKDFNYITNSLDENSLDENSLEKCFLYPFEIAFLNKFEYTITKNSSICIQSLVEFDPLEDNLLHDWLKDIYIDLLDYDIIFLYIGINTQWVE